MNIEVLLNVNIEADWNGLEPSNAMQHNLSREVGRRIRWGLRFGQFSFLDFEGEERIVTWRIKEFQDELSEIEGGNGDV